MPNMEKCLIVMVLDRSGSMSAIREDIIGGVNIFIADQAKFPGKCDVTLTQFDTEYEIVYQNQAINLVRPLDQNSFVPRGGTALLDAIGKTINSTATELVNLPEDQKPGKVYFVIVTDGEENSSREFSLDKIKEMIEHYRNLGWSFVFLGANIDAIKVATSIGISAGSSMNYTCSSAGVAGTYGALSKKMGSTRSGQTDEVEFDDEDREASQAP